MLIILNTINPSVTSRINRGRWMDSIKSLPSDFPLNVSAATLSDGVNWLMNHEQLVDPD